jgi:3,4-dihydroxy 2-butanone 4-phosphate synthase/GTP cyclohydrolase II
MASPRDYPVVTLAYAQSIDGSLSIRQGQSTAISDSESHRLTHQLRAQHEGILVGIGTVLADDPKLDVRLVSGDSPRPIILDAELRLPLTARLLKSSLAPIIFTGIDAPSEKEFRLREAGAVVARCACQEGRLNLSEVLTNLTALGIKTLVVEGGVQVLSSFLAAEAWHLAVITIAPHWLGGYGGVGPPNRMIPLVDVQIESAGSDVILAGIRE